MFTMMMEKQDHSKRRQAATKPQGVTTYKITIHSTFYHTSSSKEIKSFPLTEVA